MGCWIVYATKRLSIFPGGEIRGIQLKVKAVLQETCKANAVQSGEDIGSFLVLERS